MDYVREALACKQGCGGVLIAHVPDDNYGAGVLCAAGPLSMPTTVSIEDSPARRTNRCDPISPAAHRESTLVAFGPFPNVREVWRLNTPCESSCQSSAWVGTDGDEEAVFFATLEPDNLVYRVDGATGKMQWMTSMGPSRNGMRCSPLVYDGLLHIATDNGSYAALDADTGQIV
eukprot:UC4_evm4s1092